VFGGCFLNSSRSLTGVRDLEISDEGCLPTSIQPQFPHRDNEGFHNNDSSIGDETLPVCHPPDLNLNAILQEVHSDDLDSSARNNLG
jgi:hypothetical protein